jgi:phospholipid transport system substrate-binding protein
MREIVMIKRRALRGLSFAIGVGLALIAARTQAAAPDPADVVRGFYATLLQTMQHGPALGASGRYDRLEPAVRETFDVGLMTRLAVGPSWDSLSPAQQQGVTGAFERYVAATYADRFDSYAGERLEVTGQTAFASGLIVQTRIVKSNGEPVGINYLMRRGGDGWRVADVYLDGTISELATRRSEFSAILRDRGIAGLIAALDQRTDRLSGAARDSS